MLIDFIFVTLCALCIVLILTKSSAGPLLILLAYTQMSGVASSFFVETGVYITETGRSSHHLGATRWYALTILSLFLLILAFQKITRKFLTPPHHQKEQSTPHRRHMVYGLYAILLILYTNLLISGPPILYDEVNRFNFWESHSKIPFINSLFGELSIPVIIAASILIAEKIRNNPNQKIPTHYKAIVTLYLVYLFLLEHKFNGFVIALSFLIAPIAITRKSLGLPLISYKHLTYALISLLAMLYMSYLFFSKSTGGVIDAVGGNAIYGVFYRALALQGYSWHSFYESYLLYGEVPIPSSSETMEYAITAVTANPNFFLDNGINIANIYPGVMLLSEGLSGLLYSTLIFSAAAGTLSTISLNLIEKGSLLRATIATQLLFWTIGAIPSCNISVFHSTKFMALTALLFALPHIKKIIFKSTGIRQKRYLPN